MSCDNILVDEMNGREDIYAALRLHLLLEKTLKEKHHFSILGV